MSRSVRFVGAWFVVVVGVSTMSGMAPAYAALGTGPWSRPVDGPVVRGFDPPETVFGPGHLGVDFAVAPGTAVRAAGDGVVAFAGRVGLALHVVVRHPGDIRTTDSFLATVAVVTGQAVRLGALLGTSGGTGPGHGAGVLHFGVRVGSVSVDPLLLFATPDLAAIVHLAPPRHGVGSGADVDAGPAAERAVIASESRVDATKAVGPPPWWSDAEAAPRARRSPAPASPTRAAQAATGRTSGSGPTVPVVGGSVVGASVLLVAHRRRRRATGRRSGRTSRPPAWSRPEDLRLHSNPARDSSRPSERGSSSLAGSGSKPTDDTRP